MMRKNKVRIGQIICTALGAGHFDAQGRAVASGRVGTQVDLRWPSQPISFQLRSPRGLGPERPMRV